MSFSDKFKKSLNLRDADDVEVFTCCPLVANKISNLPKKSGIDIPSLDSVITKGNKFADLAIDTIEKINKNPFWSEYSKDSKEKMISKYFDNKVKRAKYKGTVYSDADKLAFIDGVLKAVV